MPPTHGRTCPSSLSRSSTRTHGFLAGRSRRTSSVGIGSSHGWRATYRPSGTPRFTGCRSAAPHPSVSYTGATQGFCRCQESGLSPSGERRGLGRARGVGGLKRARAWLPRCDALCTGIEIQNRGQIKFVRTSPASCNVTLVISYELPEPLVPFANVSRPRERAMLMTLAAWPILGRMAVSPRQRAMFVRCSCSRGPVGMPSSKPQSLTRVKRGCDSLRRL
jgi:hypothetical protein